jgi:hypothetical protein
MYKNFHADQALRQDIFPEIIKKKGKEEKHKPRVGSADTDLMCHKLDRGEL